MNEVVEPEERFRDKVRRGLMMVAYALVIVVGMPIIIMLVLLSIARDDEDEIIG